MKLRKAYINLFLDTVIGLAFLVEAVSGFVLWLVLPQGGFRGGRNPAFGRTFILSRGDWLTLHDWGALIMVAGIVIHLVLHWRWIVCMVRDLWRNSFRRPEKAAIAECPTE